MKSTLSKNIILFIFFTLLTGTLFYFFAAGIDSAVDPVNLLPENTGVLIDVKKPAENINRFRKSRLGTQLSSIKWNDVLRESGVGEERVREFLSLTEEIEAIVGSPVFEELFTNRVLLGLIPPDPPNPGWRERTGIERMAVLIARPRHRASLVDIFIGLFLDKFSYSVEPYKGREIRTFTYDSRYPVSTTVTDGLFIASLSPQLVKQCIDNSIANMTSVGTGLKGNTNYLQLKERARGRDDQFVYVDVPNLKAILEAGGDGDELHHDGPRNPFDLDQTCLQRAALFRQPGKKTQSYSSILQYLTCAGQSGRRIFDWYKPDRDSLLPLLPDNNVVHLWVNTFNAPVLWNFLQHEQNIYAQALVKNAQELIEEKTEYTIDEFLSLFGNQLSINIAEMKASGIIPMPKISLYVEVHDMEKVHVLLDRLLADLQVKHSTLGGRDVYSVVLAGGLMQPSFMFLDKFLVMADSRKQLENLFSAQKKSLLSNPLFKKVDVGLTDANNIVLYFRDAELIDGIKELVRWYGSLLQLFDSESLARNRVIIEKIVLPLLEGMKMYKVKTMRIYAGEKEVIMRSAQLMLGN